MFDVMGVLDVVVSFISCTAVICYNVIDNLKNQFACSNKEIFFRILYNSDAGASEFLEKAEDFFPQYSSQLSSFSI